MHPPLLILLLQGGLVLRQLASDADRAAASFAMRGAEGAAFQLEPLSAPGTRLRLPARSAAAAGGAAGAEEVSWGLGLPYC